MRKILDAAGFRRAEHIAVGLTAVFVLITVIVSIWASQRALSAGQSWPWVSIGWMLLACLVENIFRFWRWVLTANALKLNLKIHRLAYFYVAGFGLIPTPGKVGTLIRLWFLNKYEKLPYTRTAPLVVMDYMSDVFGICGLAMLSLAFIDQDQLRMLGVLTTTLFIIGLLVVFVAPRWILRMLAWLKSKLKGRSLALCEWAEEMLRVTLETLGPRLMITTSLLSFAGWGVVGIAIGHLVSAVAMPISSAQGSLVITSSIIGGTMTMLPAGAGGADVTIAALLASYGVEWNETVFLTAIIRFIDIWLPVLVGLVLLPFALKNTPR